MSEYKVWKSHFDRIPESKLKEYLNAVRLLNKDGLIHTHLGSELESLEHLIKGSIKENR
jgi:uncharacterized protein YbcC (UPF0753/DUF2309 family)